MFMFEHVFVWVYHLDRHIQQPGVPSEIISKKVNG